MALIAGLDGCHSGWLCLVKDTTTGSISASILPQISGLLTVNPVLALVDIPIGLTDAGPRQCDLDARMLLKKPRSNSVFAAPIRPMLTAITHTQACQIGQAADGRKLSRQAWGILPKIREVDAFLRADLTRQKWLREVHPEVCFRAWNASKAMTNRKKSTAGRIEREALVLPCYGAAYGNAQKSLPRGQYANDDLLDAFAALWSAERVLAGTGMVLPANPPVDACGLRMEMVV